MEGLRPEDLEELVHELEEEHGVEEPLAPDVEQYLQDLQPENVFITRKEAVEELGRLGTSHPRIVRALIAVKVFDESYLIRTLAAESLRAPVHQEILGQQPDLEALAAAEVSAAPIPGRRGAVLRQHPELKSWVEEAFPHGAEDLLHDLQSDRPATREEAAQWLGELNASSFQIAQALLEVAESDSILRVREAALESLGLPVHQETLQEYPDLMQRTRSAAEQAATQRQRQREKERAMKAPKGRKKPVSKAKALSMILVGIAVACFGVYVSTGIQTLGALVITAGVAMVGWALWNWLAPGSRRNVFRRSMKETTGTVERIDSEVHTIHFFEGSDRERPGGFLFAGSNREKGGIAARYHSSYFVTVLFAADYASRGTRVIALHARLAQGISKGMKHGETVGIRYAAENPRIALIHGEW